MQRQPIIISAPVRRSGTTLLQRLLSSSSNGIIFGETCANDFLFGLNLFLSRQSVLGMNNQWRNQQLQAVLAGEVNDWIPDLMPNIDAYLTHYKDNIQHLLNFYAEFAQKNNRPVWGMKLPEWSPALLVQAQQFLPGTKIIYITRNLKDCVRSAKAIGMIQSPQDTEQFCRTWVHHRQMAKQMLKGASVLHLSYEDFIQNTSDYQEAITVFTGCQQIDWATLNQKLNKFRDTPAENGIFGAYQAPGALDEQEERLVNQYDPSIEQTPKKILNH